MSPYITRLCHLATGFLILPNVFEDPLASIRSPFWKTFGHSKQHLSLSPTAPSIKPSEDFLETYPLSETDAANRKRKTNMKTNRSQQSAVAGQAADCRHPSAPWPNNPSLCTPHSALCTSPFSLRNDYGFWSLTYGPRSAVVPQHQALFYVACLLDNPCPVLFPGAALAAKAFDRYAEHPDFDLSTSQLHRDQSDVAAVLRSKHRALTATLDREDLDPILKDEAERELQVVEQFQFTVRAEMVHSANQTAEAILDTIRDLYNTLARAVDPRGNPHPLLRAFALHILWHILIPATRSTFGGRPPTFIYL
jgi:hypothetical protein